MAGKFKYLKKAITTITKGPRKGGKYTRYHYKGSAFKQKLRTQYKSLQSQRKRVEASLKKEYERKGARGGIVALELKSADLLKKADAITSRLRGL